jgi:peptidylprolyl isomerase/peptidyl-prolyl cis-trans isomerase D
VLEEEMSRLGIKVSDQEIRDWVYGENPPEDLRRYFVDSTGQFIRQNFEAFLHDPDRYIRDPRGENPNYGTKWLADYEKNLRQRRMQEKLQGVITASIRVGEGEVLQRYLDQFQQYNALYTAFDANALVRDDSVTVGDADLRAFYDETIDQYKTEASRKLKYVVFADIPSANDSATAEREIEEAASKARAGTDFIQLTAMYSEKPDSGTTFHRGELSAPVDQAVFSATIGEVVGPLKDNEGYRLFKVLREKQGTDEYIHARHILLPLGADSSAARAQALALLKEARAGKDFAVLASGFSKDGTAQQGGDLGWFKKGRMVPAFEAAAFKARVGEIVGPVRTPFGYHIIKVEGRDNRERTVSVIQSKIQVSSQTKNDQLDRARDFVATARESDFATDAQQLGFEVRETQVQGRGGVVPGIGLNENITRWAFDAKVGAVSEPFAVTGGHAVFTVVEKKEEGVRPFEELKESLRPQALRKKKLQMVTQMAAALRGKLADGDSLYRVHELNPAIAVQSTGSFTLAGVIPGIGRDPAFVGTVSALKVGEISPAVQGMRGAYLIQLLSKSALDSASYAVQRDGIRARMLQEKRSRFFSEWLQELKDRAQIDDRRSLYQ